MSLVSNDKICPVHPWFRLVPFPNAWQGCRLCASDYLLIREASIGLSKVLNLFGILTPWWGRGKE